MNEILIKLSLLYYIDDLILSITSIFIIFGFVYFTFLWLHHIIDDTYYDFAEMKMKLKNSMKKHKRMIIAYLVIILFYILIPTKTQLTLYYLGNNTNQQQINNIVEKLSIIEKSDKK
jgi:membrane-anchored glycerophosphoryl diester phosphodiesterase (GDPDase)